MNASPPLVTLHVWRVPRRALGGALTRMALDPRRLRRLPGVRFGKLLGTGTGLSFGPGDADLTRYAAVVSWDAADGGDLGVVGAAWDRLAQSSARVDLTPIMSHGGWSGQKPFGESSRRPASRPPGTASTDAGEPAGGFGRTGEMVLALTRARLRAVKALTFWNAVPPVARELAGSPGLLARFGVGEAPVGWQGTVSVWRSSADLTTFAYRQPEHRAVIERTAAVGWYAEDLFARFAVRDISGDRAVLGWREGER
ncbi:monooxygenase [Actinoplanes sp. TFC3]|uniref:monooxygenase n=1 Tax=Actinoplanes sp. TFC3 TaxID=1710355 RepID=UPI0008349D90|nr:monooxygenase [Actinoplanes sp. TFC3]